MIYRLVTLEYVKRHRRYDQAYDDARLLELIDDASEIIMNYIGDTNPAALEGWTNSNGPLVDDDGFPQAQYLLTDSNGAVLDSNGLRQYYVADAEYDSNGNIVNGGISVIPGYIRRATVLAIGSTEVNAEGQVDMLTPGVRSLLDRTRTPVVV